MDFAFRNFTILIMLIISVCSWKPKQSSKPPAVCRHRQCTERGQWYAAHLNTRADPCVDFYEYVCGAWDKVHPAPPYVLEWDFLEILNQEAFADIRKLLEAPVKKSEPDVYRKAKIAYQLCVDRPYMPRVTMQTINKHIKTVRAVAQQLPWVAHDEYLKLTGESPFFMYLVLVDKRHKCRPVLEFKSQVNAFGSIIYSKFKKWTTEQINDYKEFLMDIYKDIAAVNNQPFVEDVAARNIERLITFRTELNQLMQKQNLLQRDQFVPLTIDQLQEWYDGIIEHSPRNNIDWRNIVKILYSGKLLKTVGAKKLLSIRRKQFFEELTFILYNTPLDVINRHIETFFIERHLIYTEKMVRILRDIIDRSDEIAGYPLGNMPRWLSCIESHPMRHVVGMIFSESHLNPKNIKPITELTMNLKDAILQYVNESSDTSNIMKAKVTERMNNVRIEIGRPNWYLDLAESPSLSDDVTFVANANFHITRSRIYITTTLTRQLMFDEALPFAINIGSFGVMIGHELNHLFGDCGRYCENKEISWWPERDRTQCEKKKQCFIDEYAKYVTNELSFLNNGKINTEHTFIEDAADVMGLKIAYRHYSQVYSQNKCKVLPHFEQFTCDQMFFIAFANVLCGSSNMKFLANNYKKMDHSTRRIRVNGAVMHNDNFATAFDCPVEAPMNPKKKCDLWKQ